MISLRLPLLVILGLLSLPAWGGEKTEVSDEKLAAAAESLLDGLQVETLPNGLQVYLLPIPTSPTVTTMVAYRVGSCDEEKDQTGLSHYLEHLLFKGTEKLMPGDIDRATQRNGGQNNAYTSEDMTCYHFDFAADRWKIALEIEADRMRNVRIDEKHEFHQEKGAVVAELKRNEDAPWELENKAILPLLYPAQAPYSHPVIGEESHVRGATAEIIRRHYDKWYHPNNASIVIVGGFDPKDALATIQKLFGTIAKADLPARKETPKLETREKQIRKEFVSKFDVPRLMIGFNTVRYGEPDDYALDLVEDVLASGKTSRLYKRLVEGDRLANTVSAGNMTGRHPGWFSVQVEMLKGKDRAKAEAAVFEELEKLAKEPVTDAELKRVRRAALANFVFSRESVHALCDAIARSVTIKDIDSLKSYLKKIRAVTPEQMRLAAEKYLAKQKSVVVWSLADEKGNSTRGSAKNQLARSESVPSAGNFPLENLKRTVLPNGMKVLLLENRRLPIVVAEAHIANVRLREPEDKAGVSALMGAMLMEGTDKHTGKEIATLIEDVGGSLSVDSGSASLKVLSPDADLGLSLFFECMRTPSFPQEALEQQREQLLSMIADAETQPRNRSSRLFSSMVYGKHPFGRSAYGNKEIVAKLTAKELKQFHSGAYRADAMTIVMVGDFDSSEMLKKIEQLTEGWPKLTKAAPTPAEPPSNLTATEKIISDPTAAQTHVFIGHLGIKRDDPDYYALLVMDNVLGVGPGFTDRLSAKLRDRQGLAYTVNAQIAAGSTEQPGTFVGYIGTFPDKYQIAKEGFLAEIALIRKEKPTEIEVEDAKKYLLGSLPFRFTTNEGVAHQILAAERFGLGSDFQESFRKKIAAVTPEEVRRVAEKHLDPKKLIIVAVGPIGEDGKPLPEAAPKK